MTMALKALLLVVLMMVATGYSREMICDEKPVDLAILVDSSSSITQKGSQHLTSVKEFIKSYLSKYNIAKDGTHAAVIRYSTEAELLFDFTTYDKTIMDAQIDKIEARGNTYQNKALQMAYDDVFTTRAGMRNDAKNVLLLFTDGAQSNRNIIPKQPEQIATELKNDKSVVIYTVAVGSDKSTFKDLNNIASQPVEDHTFFANSFGDLSALVDKVIDKQCKPAPTPPPKIGTCHHPVDVALIIDSSNSISTRMWQEVQNIAKKILGAFKISPKYSHVAIIRYNTHAKAVMKFNNDVQGGPAWSNENVYKFIDNMKKYNYHGPDALDKNEIYTFIDRALKFADDEVFTNEAGMRDDTVKKMCFLLTDGMQTNYKFKFKQPHEVAHSLKVGKNVKIFTVGIGSNVDVEELTKIATSPNESYSDTDESIQELVTNTKDLTSYECIIPS